MEVKRILITLNVARTTQRDTSSHCIIIKHEVIIVLIIIALLALIASMKVSCISISILLMRFFFNATEGFPCNNCISRNNGLLNSTMSRHESANTSVYILQSMTLRETRPRRGIDRSIQIDIYTLANRLTRPIDRLPRKQKYF